MGKVILVPTSHIAEESLGKVREIVDKERPDCIAVELDVNRYIALKDKKASSMELLKAVGPLTFLLFLVLKKLQEHLGGQVGILPGSEMLAAVEIGRRRNVQVAFIDMDIRTTLKNINAVGAGEKLKLLWFLLKGMFSGEKVEIDLNKIPSDKLIEEAMGVFREEFPGLYRALITERNRYMAAVLKRLSGRFEKVVAVIGAGHYRGIGRLLED
jgi:pheromone shutdown-related protein TraB